MYRWLLSTYGDVQSTYGFKRFGVVLELLIVMFGRIMKFRRGDQYEEMEGRDVAGKTTDPVRPTPNVNRTTNEQPDGNRDATASRQDTTPEGKFLSMIFSKCVFTIVSILGHMKMRGRYFSKLYR